MRPCWSSQSQRCFMTVGYSFVCSNPTGRGDLTPWTAAHAVAQATVFCNSCCSGPCCRRLNAHHQTQLLQSLQIQDQQHMAQISGCTVPVDRVRILCAPPLSISLTSSFILAFVLRHRSASSAQRRSVPARSCQTVAPSG